MKIPPTYFRNVDASTWLGVPIVFGLLPLAGFYPSKLECILPTFAMAFVLANQVTVQAGNTRGGSITLPLTSCFTGLD